MTITMPVYGWWWNWNKPSSRLPALAVILVLLLFVPAGAEAEGVTIVLQGNHAFSTAQLLSSNRQAAAALKERGQDHADADDLAYYLKQFYVLAGYAWAAVNYHFVEKARGQRQAVFDIQEGPRVRIQKILFQGEHFFTASILQTMMRQQLSQNSMAGPDIYVAEAVTQSLNDIRNRYLREGFYHVRIGAARLTFHEQKTLVTITISLEEGRRYFITAIDFGPTADLVPQKDRENLEKKWQGRPYVEEKNTILAQQVRQLYLEQGYAEVKLQVAGISITSPGRMTIHLQITPGPKVIITAIKVKGNHHVSRAFVLKRLVLRPGMTYSQSAWDKSFFRLLRTGLFKNITLALEKETPDKRVLLVKVKENRLAKIYVEPGWGNYELLRLLAGYEQSSLFGSGQQLNVEGKISFKERSLKVQLQNPDFLFDGLTSQVTGFGQYRIEPAYNRKEYGLGVQFYPTWIEKMDLTAGYVLSAVTLEVPYSAQNVPAPGNYEIGTASLNWRWDDRDNLLFPGRGTLATAGLEMVDPLLGQQMVFYRTTWEIRHYWSVVGSSILAIRVMGGLILMTQANNPLPVSERFFNGGENSVRSFSQSELGPKDPNGRPAGGLGFNTLNVSWRQEIIDPWYLNLFFDYGNISPSANRTPLVRATSLKATLDDFFLNFRPGLGLGVQYLLPIGTARLEVAFNPDQNRDLGEPLYQVNLGLGTAF